MLTHSHCTLLNVLKKTSRYTELVLLVVKHQSYALNYVVLCVTWVSKWHLEIRNYQKLFLSKRSSILLHSRISTTQHFLKSYGHCNPETSHLQKKCFKELSCFNMSSRGVVRVRGFSTVAKLWSGSQTDSQTQHKCLPSDAKNQVNRVYVRLGFRVNLDRKMNATIGITLEAT